MTVNDYKLLEKHTVASESYADYVECMFEACAKLGLENVVIYCDGREDYQGEMDIHVEAIYQGKAIYYYLNQGYGSCSVCDWIQGAGEDEVTEEYVKNLKEALGID